MACATLASFCGEHSYDVAFLASFAPLRTLKLRVCAPSAADAWLESASTNAYPCPCRCALHKGEPMRSWKAYALLALLMTTMLASVEAQQHTYQSFNGNVPFSFNIGERKFHAGYYEFVVAAPGIMVMRDAHQHVLATLFTRELKGIDREVASRMVFDQGKHH